MNKTDLRNHSTCAMHNADFKSLMDLKGKLLKKAEKDLVKLIQVYGEDVEYHGDSTKGIRFEKPIYLHGIAANAVHADMIFITVPVGYEPVRVNLCEFNTHNKWYRLGECLDALPEVFLQIGKLISKQAEG